MRLTWPKRPRVERCKSGLGRRQIWLAAEGGYRVHRLLDARLPLPYVALRIGRFNRPPTHHRTLRAAQRACERDWRDEKPPRRGGRQFNDRGRARRHSAPFPAATAVPRGAAAPLEETE